MTVTFDSDEPVTRRFDMSSSKLWDTLCGDDGRACLRARGRVDRLAELFANVHGTDAKPIAKILKGIVNDESSLASDEPLPSYFANFCRQMRDDSFREPDRGLRYRIVVKACNEHYWYAMQSLPAENERSPTAPGFSCPPYFKEATPPQDQKQRADVRGMADTLLFLGPEIKEAFRRGQVHGKTPAARREHADRALENLIRWFTVSLDCTVESNGDQELRLNVDPSVSVGRTIELPWNDQSILVSSPNVRAAILELADVWMAPNPQPVAVCAWTGSGKGVLVELFIQALLVDPAHRCTVVATELESFELFRKAIAGQPASFTSGRSVLFIDEIHHDNAEGLRAGLLRTIQEKKVSGSGSADDVSLADTSFVVAGSKSWAKMRESGPKDFWDRFENPVQMRHPLDVAQPNVRPDVVRDYFLLFWRQSLKTWNADGRRRMEAKIAGFLEADETQRALADVFAQLLGSPLQEYPGMRQFSGIVHHVFAKTVSYLEDCSASAIASALPGIVEAAPSWIVARYRTVVEIHPDMF